MDADFEKWRRSYDHLPIGAGDDEISNSSTDDLEAAHRLMEPCNEKPPGFQIELSGEQVSSFLSEPSLWSPYFHNLALNEGLRYARVCKELATRVEGRDGESALGLFKSALLPSASALAFESYDARKSWWDRANEGLLGLVGVLSELPTESGAYDRAPNLLVLAMEWFLDLEGVTGMVSASFVIAEKQDAWNFWIKASMVGLEQRLGHGEEASRLRDECLAELGINDDLWTEVLNRLGEKAVVSFPAPALPTGPMSEAVETAVARVLQLGLEPLVRSMHENLQITHAIQDRIDFVVERLIDLDQRSQLTWQEVSRLARQEPDYEELRRNIEASLASRLGNAWLQLRPDSQEDLVDAEFVFGQCNKAGKGWRMAVLGYCTTAERELPITYAAIRDQLFPVGDTHVTTTETLGDLIQALEKLGMWLPKSKPPPPSLKSLLNSLDVLKRLNVIRVRAAHPKKQRVSGEEAVWVREALLTSQSGPLLLTIVAARPKT
jgi:hypothetical protein